MLRTHAGEPDLDIYCDSSFLSLPADCGPGPNSKRVLWRQLSATDRALLGTDGTFTVLLEALRGEPIAVRALSQSVRKVEHEDCHLRLERESSLLERTVLLYGRSNGRVMAYAESFIALDRLAQSMRRDLEDGDKPIGLLLRRAGVETFRELLDWGQCQRGHRACEYLSARRVLFRTYRIVAHAHPIAVITECFPIAPTPDVGREGRQDV